MFTIRQVVLKEGKTYHLILKEPNPTFQENLLLRKPDPKQEYHFHFFFFEKIIFSKNIFGVSFRSLILCSTRYDGFLLTYEHGNHQSFQIAKRLFLSLQKFYPDVPALFVATKIDLQSAEQSLTTLKEETPEGFCSGQKLPPPILVSAKNNKIAHLFPTIMSAIVEYTNFLFFAK